MTVICRAHAGNSETAVTVKRQKTVGGRVDTVVRGDENPVVPKSVLRYHQLSLSHVFFIERPIQVQVRLFQRSRDWDYKHQAPANCGPQGELDLHRVAEVLGVEGCQVIYSVRLGTSSELMILSRSSTHGMAIHSTYTTGHSHRQG